MFKKLGFILLILAAFSAIFLLTPEDQKQLPTENKPSLETEFWPYRCIDTMKTSRDNAQKWQYWSGLDSEIEKEISAIDLMGANCVAIDTPYDAEFLPYLKKWVKSARKHNLKIWFRGNFSSWEGWFNYPKNLTSAKLLTQTTIFIEKNSDLFQNGDIFTAAPEAENGGEFNQVETDEYETYRKFLTKEVEIQNLAFTKINKKVTTNWLSMNGGLAKRMFDQPTVNLIDKLVAIDHYIKTAPEMGEYINYFNLKFNAQVAIGEFGAPIPEINGVMSPEQQADFVSQLLHELYINRQKVAGLNYWDLMDGSTALLNFDHSPRKVVGVLENYFKPSTIDGTISDPLGRHLKDIKIQAEGGETLAAWDGSYRLLVPAGETDIKISGQNYYPQNIHLSLNPNQKVTQDLTLQPLDKDSFGFHFQLWIQNIRNRIEK